MKTKETSVKQRLYNKKYNSYAEWNGSAWEDKSIAGAYFHSIEKANANGWFEEESTREQASKWFANKSYLEQHELSDKYFESRNPSLLTIEQVEEIWRKETQ